VSIIGEQGGFIVCFTVKQVFYHTSPSPADVRYIIPNDIKICMYDTEFRVGSETIKVVLEEKKAAKEMYDEATSEGRAAIFGQSLGNALVEFQLGNLPPGESCEVEVKCAFTASSPGPSGLFFKFSLDVCTPSGSVSCISNLVQESFLFSAWNLDPSAVSTITSNAAGTYDESQTLLTINTKPSDASVIVTTTLRRPLASERIVSGTVLAVTKFAARFPARDIENNEFVFLIDCSGSMSGDRIDSARACLGLFICSLPAASFLNVIRFGSSFQSLLPESSPDSEQTIQRGSRLRRQCGRTSAARTSSSRLSTYGRSPRAAPRSARSSC
jgi:hypothetical protein